MPVIRKKEVGQSGNGGQFAARTHAADTLNLGGVSEGGAQFPSRQAAEVLDSFLNANDPRVSAKTLLQLSGHRSDAIRLSVASNPRADAPILYALSRDTDVVVAAAARAHRNYRPHTLADRLQMLADRAFGRRFAA